MQIDTLHLHHWMQAIRKSSDPMRTMDAFWSGQLKSKEWLVDSLEYVIRTNINAKPLTIEIHGGWVGTLASMLFQSKLNIKHITSIDIDPECKCIAEEMNKLEEMQGRFSSVTCDMAEYDSTSDIIINTSFEHITQEQHDVWKNRLPSNALIVLQSNNYNIPEHVRIAQDLTEFRAQAGLNVIFKGELELPIYKRYMIIGTK